MATSDEPGGIFTFTNATHVEICWYVAWQDTDWLGVLYRDDAAAPWRVTYRFRYYTDDKVFGSADRKSVYEVTGSDGSAATRDHLVAAFDALTTKMATMQRGQRWRVVVRGSARRFYQLYSRQPFAHVRVTVPGPTDPQ